MRTHFLGEFQGEPRPLFDRGAVGNAGCARSVGAG